MSGLRRNTSVFPNATRAVLRHILLRLKAKFDQVSFGAFGLFCNIKTPLHADVRNEKGELNYVSPLCAFKNGEVWVEQPQGPDKLAHGDTVLEGYDMPVAKGPCSLDPARRYCTQDWEGSCIVCVCFTPARLEALNRDDAMVLRDLGFPLRDRNRVESRDLATSLPSPTVSSVTVEPSTKQAEDVAFGVYFSEAEFVREAMLLGHPRSLCGSLPDHIAEAVHALASRSHHDVRSKRHQWLSKWAKRAAEIQAKPDQQWASEDEAMAGVLSQKRLQLLHEIIQAEGYADKDLAKDIHRGFDLVGRCPSSGVLPGKLVPASLDAESLLSCARKVQGALKSTLGPSGDDAMDRELWDKTMLEVKRGWLLGPYEWDSLGPREVPSHRFPLRQGSKLRPIDDYSLSGVNACVTTLEAPTVDAADVACGMASKLCWSLRDKGRCARLVGRSYDLTSQHTGSCASARLPHTLP